MSTSIYPASDEGMKQALAAPVAESGDGRSPWMWVTLSNGDLMLATFPQGANYEALAPILQADFDLASKQGTLQSLDEETEA